MTPATTSTTGTREFTVSGPFDVPVVEDNGYRRFRQVDASALSHWWLENPKRSRLSTEKGCYVFAMSSGRGTMPIYVGMTTNSFKSKCFDAANQIKINAYLNENRGRLVLFLVKYPKSKRVNRTLVKKLEDQLIGMAFSRNPSLLNKHGTKEEERMPRIRGVLRSGRGQPPKEAIAFRKMIGVKGD